LPSLENDNSDHSLFSLQSLSPSQQRLSKRRRRFEPDQMAGVGNSHDLGIRNILAEDVGVDRRNEPILFSPNDQRRRFDPPESSLQSVFGNREEEFSDRAEAARHRKQDLGLILGAVILIAEEHGQHHHSLSREA